MIDPMAEPINDAEMQARVDAHPDLIDRIRHGDTAALVELIQAVTGAEVTLG